MLNKFRSDTAREVFVIGLAMATIFVAVGQFAILATKFGLIAAMICLLLEIAAVSGIIEMRARRV